MSGELYQRVLGEAWWSVAEPIRCVHAPGRNKQGCFYIVHGTNNLARRITQWSRLPRTAKAAQTQLSIIAEGAGERWERQFDNEIFTTRQWADDQGRLVERYGSWELSFVLQEEKGQLAYRQTRARFCLGPFRLNVPRACAPQVVARETCVGPARVQVTVTVTLPLIGLLLRYDGNLDVGVAQ